MKVLITGINGSGASYLAEYLVGFGLDVHGIVRWHSTANYKNLSKIINNVTLHECDLTDLSSVIRTLKKCKPDIIFHLAAHANVKVCFDNPIAVLNNNINNTINLFEAIRIVEIDPVIQFCGTSEVYGKVEREECPITELHELKPANIYAVSKLTQEKIAMSYYYSYNMKVILTRMFAYINPRRADIFSTAFAKQAIKVKQGKQTVVKHGNLDSIRTLLDIRDVVEAYWTAVNECEFGIPYNIGNEKPISVRDFLEILRCKIPFISEIDENLLRPVDVTMQIPDVQRFFAQTTWEPKYNLEESVDFLINSLESSND